MRHSPTFQTLRRLLLLARESRLGKPTSPPQPSTVARVPPMLTRREFLGSSSLAAASLARPPFRPRNLAGGPHVAIVGGGIAGLVCAYRLQQSGIIATVYEAATRIGGRLLTARGLFEGGQAQNLELGGEFIDSNHLYVRRLVSELGLSLVDFRDDDSSLESPTLYFSDRRYTEEEMVEAFGPIEQAMSAARASMIARGNYVSYQHPSNAQQYDNQSITQFLDSIDTDSAIKAWLISAYIGEYGLDCDEQSALNLILMEPFVTARGRLALFGTSDERFKVEGGMDQLPTRLADALANPVQLEHRLVSLRPSGSSYDLTFDVSGTTYETEADYVVITLPFSCLRQVDLQVKLSDVKRNAIMNVGYGTNAKLLQAFTHRIWREQGSTGAVYTDLPFEECWDSSQLQSGLTGVITYFAGGAEGVRMGEGSAFEQAARYLPDFDRIFPGAADIATGNPERMHWPSEPYALGSYMCPRPGQYTSMMGCFGEPEGRILFAGEHCSYDWWGWINGAIESAEVAAEDIAGATRNPRNFSRRLGASVAVEGRIR